MVALPQSLPPPLPAPYRSPAAAEGLRPTRAVVALVRGQVQALLDASPAAAALPPPTREALTGNLVKIASYAAECIREDWLHSAHLGQRPLVRYRQTSPARAPAPTARALADLQPNAANQIGRVTRETLNAIAFPTFVADLIRGTFGAIVQSSIQQMEAYVKLIENVSKTVDQFMAENISDNQARDWLAQRYPEHLRVEVSGDEPRLVPAPNADDKPLPDWRTDLDLREDASLDESSIEEVLVPAARRKLAQSRLQVLATLVLMGINRIVVSGGKIRAAMNFHIDTTDRAKEQHASDFDLRVAAAGSFGFGPWSASVSTSVGYVTSSRSESESEINTDTNLSSEVEIHFKSDYFPLARVADGGTIGKIRSNTPVPEANPPEAIPWGGSAPPQVPVRAPAQTLPPLPPMPGLGSAPRLPEKPLAPAAVAPPPPAPTPPAKSTPPAAAAPAPTPAVPPATTAPAPTAAPGTAAPAPIGGTPPSAPAATTTPPPGTTATPKPAAPPAQTPAPVAVGAR